MQRTLHEHIIFLEQRLQALSDQLTDPARSAVERSRIQSELERAELALSHYRRAFELEQELT